MGNMSTEVACDLMEAQPQNDCNQLDKAKKLTNSKGVNERVTYICY